MPLSLLKFAGHFIAATLFKRKWARRSSGLQEQPSLHHSAVFVITQHHGLQRQPLSQMQQRASADGHGVVHGQCIQKSTKERGVLGPQM